MLDCNLPIGTSLLKKKKISTSRPSTREKSCPFNIAVLCSKSDHKWYLKYQSGNYKCDGNHNLCEQLCIFYKFSYEYLNVLAG